MGTVASRQRAEEARPARSSRGVVERLTYQNPENGYTVARLAPERPEGRRAAQGDDRLVTLVDTWPTSPPARPSSPTAGGRTTPSTAGSSRCWTIG